MPKGKQKTFTTPKKKQSKNQPLAPESAADYLALGVSHEEAGEKHRAGDAAKSARFFIRAIDTYEEGLQRWGNDFDLWYNKARVQYQMTQYPTLLAQSSSSSVDLLRTALISHRRALALDPASPDVLFNTAQVLTSLGEALDSQHDELPGGVPVNSLQLLEEAITIFQQCLSRQEAMYQQTLVGMPKVPEPDEEEEPTHESAPSTSEQEDGDSASEQWASILEPVTKLSLLETASALLDTLALMCSMLPSSQPAGVNIVEGLGQSLILEKLPVMLEGVEPELNREATITVAKFKAALLEAKFKCGLSDIREYDQNLGGVFEDARSEILALSQSSAFLCSYADALVAFVTAVADHADFATLRWTRLTKALECLTEAGKLHDAEEVASIHVGRGDVEMLRFSLSSSTGLPESLSNSTVQATLLKNAQTYYRGAASLAQSSMRRDQDEILTSATIKQAIAACVSNGNNGPIVQAQVSGVADAKIVEVIREMIDESLVDETCLRSCGVN